MSHASSRTVRETPETSAPKNARSHLWLRVASGILGAVWLALNLVLILGLLLPVYPGALLLAAGLVTGLIYPFLIVVVIGGIVITVLALRRQKRIVAAIAGLLAVVLAVGIAWPTIGAAEAANRADTSLSVPALFQSAPSTGSSSPAETRTYRTIDGENLKVDVWEPSTEKAAEQANHASLVYVFGGGWVGGDRTQWAPFFQTLTTQGITVFSIDYRLSSPDNPSWSKSITDVRCALGWVHDEADTYGIDSDRVAISGGSAGANLALLAAYTSDKTAPDDCGTDTSVRAVIDFYGPTDLAAMESTSGSSDAKDMLHTYLGATSAEEPERYAALSPITHISAASPATLILHGTHDGMVPTAQSEDLVEALSQANVDNKLVLIGGAQHGFDMIWGTFANQAAQAEVTSFLQEHLID
jgi:acetyl esterase/lipase